MARLFRPISVTRIASAVIIILAAAALYWRVTGRQQLGSITLPNGFHIAIYGGDVPNARQMALGDNGTVFVGSMRKGNVYALVDGDGDNVAEETYTLASDLTLPSGVAFQDGALYVAALGRILRYDSIESRLANPPQPVIVRGDLPTLTHHGWRFVQFGPDGLLYLGVGMPCNICPESDGPYGTILRMKTDESDWEIFARGVRNSVGFDWDPRTGELWFTDNGRDMLGDDLPPDELNHAPTAGLHFGFPFCHGGTIADPDYGSQRECSEFTPPARRLGPHVAAIGMRFYSGEMFPSEYHNQIFIAEHGSWNRSTPIGYRITVVRLENNQAVGYEAFAEGWLQGRRPWGRPADVLVMPDGALLVSDDRQGAIYRISYGEK